MFTSNINTSMATILSSVVDIVGTDVFLYTSFLASNKLHLKVHKLNFSATPPVILNTATYNFPSAISELPVVGIYNSCLTISYGGTFGWKQQRLDKETFTPLDTTNRNLLLGGVYLPKHDMGFYRVEYQFLEHNPDNTPGTLDQVLQTFASGTVQPLNIRYVYPPDESKIFTFYSDLNYFLARNLSSLSQINASYTSPLSFTLSETGYQCSCLSLNGSLLFILLPSSTLQIFDTRAEIFLSSIFIGYSGITDCYSYGNGNGIVFVSETLSLINSGSTELIFYSLL